MINRFWARSLAACAILSTGLVAGDYDHVLDTVRQAWPERSKGLAICSLESNQFTLLDLVDTAKARGLSLVIVNLKDVRDLENTLKSALGRRPGFLLIIDDDPLLGSKSGNLPRLTSRAATLGIPAVGLSADALKYGAALAVGSAPEAKVYFNSAVIKRLKLDRPEGGIDAQAAVPPAAAPVPAAAPAPTPAP